MKPIEFITEIRQRVIDNDNKIYRDLLNNTEGATDPIWTYILPIYRNLSIEQRDLFLKFLRLIQVNTASHILGILDGTVHLNENFVLRTEADVKEINGDLQDIFLEMEQK